jgi:hypothetical protein
MRQTGFAIIRMDDLIDGTERLNERIFCSFFEHFRQKLRLKPGSPIRFLKLVVAV